MIEPSEHAATADQQLDRAFLALADPVRRSIVARLSRGPATVNELARNLRRAGAAEIRVWVVARALKHDAPFGANLDCCPY